MNKEDYIEEIQYEHNFFASNKDKLTTQGLEHFESIPTSFENLTLDELHAANEKCVELRCAFEDVEGGDDSHLVK